jgi:CBS domain-containing protein
MKHSLVRDWMSRSLIVTSPATTLPEAYRLMKERRIRRLPVVVGDNQLVGIVTIGDVREASPSDATTLSIYELNYLLSQLSVDQIMTRDVLTVGPDASIRDAARLMLEHKIGGLPVVENDKVVGILTESDIFRMIVQEWEA